MDNCASDERKRQDGDMAGLYTATKLVPGEEIRLVNILPKRQSEEIACELQVVSLRDKPKYIALSYTWGSPTSPAKEVGTEDLTRKPSYSILCTVKSNTPAENQQHWYQVLATKNLHDFLLKIRNDESHAIDSYWIDAICINQKDSEEQTSQVKMMANIYRSAEIVHAWLGEEDDDTDRAFQLIKALASCSTGNKRRERIIGLKDITPKALSTGELTARHPLFADVSNWISMAKLFHRRYFTRVWTIQEITLAQKMRALCGNHTIDWEDIVKVSEFLTVTSWTRWIFDIIGSHQPNHAVPNLLDANKTSENLLYSLIRFRRFDSGDPRDKIYALLGVAGSSVRGKSRLAPVYGNRSVAETYTLAAVQILEDSDDLLLLAYAEGDSFCTIPSLPSWVPDWSCSKILGLGVTGYKRYSAAAEIRRTLEINERDGCLTVKGFRLDEISSVGESKRDILKGSPVPKCHLIFEAMPSTYHTGQSRSEVFWRTLITDTAGAPPEHPAPDNYHSAYIPWITSKLSGCVKERVQHTGDPPLMKPFWDGECSVNSNDSVDPVEYETAFSHAVHLLLFLTSRKYLGVGSESLVEHDSIWIVPGSRVPLILREVNPGTFRIVGGAYVHGFMKGQALESSPILEDIIIV